MLRILNKKNPPAVEATSGNFTENSLCRECGKVSSSKAILAQNWWRLNLNKELCHECVAIEFVFIEIVC